MSKWGKLTLTNQGIALLAKCQTRGIQLLLTNVKLGDGYHDNDLALEDISALVSEKQTISIDSKSVVDGTTCKILCNFSNSGLANGYYLREIGLYASDPDDGEILYMVNYDSVPDYLPGRDEGSPIEQEFVIYVTVSNADNVSIEVDYERVYRKEDTYSKDEVDAAIALLQNGLATKANATDVYTKSNVYTKSEADNRYLKTSGGTMNSAINLSNPLALQRNTDDSYIQINSATSFQKGAYAILYGQNVELSDSKGAFQFTARNGNTTLSLVGRPNGDLLWGGRQVALAENVLPLSGGTVSGTITSSVQTILKRNSDNTFLNFQGGTENLKGGQLSLFGINHASGQGGFQLGATNGTGNRWLIGKADGTLTWGNDAVALAKDYLPINGGSLTGNSIYRNVDDNFLCIYGSTAWDKGAYLSLSGMNRADRSGEFRLSARSASKEVYLNGSATDNNLTWTGNLIAGSIYGNKQGASGLLGIGAGTGYNSAGGAIILYGGERTDDFQGGIALRAQDGTNTAQLQLFPSGTMIWQGKNVERVNSSGTNYIRYESGLQICWAVVNSTVVAGSDNTATLPVNFKDGNYTVLMTRAGDSYKTVYTKNRTSSNFKFVSDGGSGYSFAYIAVGYWK